MTWISGPFLQTFRRLIKRAPYLPIRSIFRLTWNRLEGLATPKRAIRVESLIALALVLAIVLTLPTFASADEPTVEAQAENSALTFVRENHQELAALLAQLKPMKPEEYRKAVRELAQVSKSLATLKTNNPRRHTAALETWKARSRVQLIAARLSNANGSAIAELESRLREAVAAQIDAEIRQAKVDKEVVEERARRLAENLAKLEAKRETAVETRVQSMLKQSQRARRSAAKSAESVKNNDNAKNRTDADESANRVKEPRP